MAASTPQPAKHPKHTWQMSNDIASNVVEARKVHFLVCISFQRLCCLWCNQTTFFNVMSSLRIVTAAFTIWFMKHFSNMRTHTLTMLSCTSYIYIYCRSTPMLLTILHWSLQRSSPGLGKWSCTKKRKLIYGIMNWKLNYSSAEKLSR